MVTALQNPGLTDSFIYSYCGLRNPEQVWRETQMAIDALDCPAPRYTHANPPPFGSIKHSWLDCGAWVYRLEVIPGYVVEWDEATIDAKIQQMKTLIYRWQHRERWWMWDYLERQREVIETRRIDNGACNNTRAIESIKRLETTSACINTRLRKPILKFT